MTNDARQIAIMNLAADAPLTTKLDAELNQFKKTLDYTPPATANKPPILPPQSPATSRRHANQDSADQVPLIHPKWYGGIPDVVEDAIVIRQNHHQPTTIMKRSTTLIKLAAALSLTLGLSFASAATPEQEATFVASYKKALESNDVKALAKFLLTDGAEEETIEFFKMMMELEPGAKIESIELVKPTAEEAAKFAKPMAMPNGKNYKMPVTPYKQLVIKTATKSADGSGSSTSKSPVAEKGGKLVIPVPVPVK